MSTLSDTEKAQLRAFLGYAQFNRFRNPKLESALDLIDGGAETMIRAEIVEVLAVNAALRGTTRTIAGIAQADDARFFGRKDGNRFDELRREGHMHIARISKTLDVPVRDGSDWFSTESSEPSNWSGTGYAIGGSRGNEIKLG
jgi:hypothetical protein